MITPIIIQVILTIICIIIVPIIYQKYHSRRWFQGILWGAILFIIGIWFSYYLQEYSEFKDNELKKNLEPKINVSFYELNNHQLQITLESLNKNASKIDDFYLIFDIPGRFTNLSEEHKYNLDDCKFLHNEKSGGWNGTSTEGIWSEYISMNCYSILPEGYYRVILNYEPTEEINFGIENYLLVRMPVMNLNDFPSYTFSWVFDGNSNSVKKCMDIRNLDYIKKDDKNSISSINCTNFPELCNKYEGMPFCTNNVSCWIDKEHFVSLRNGCKV